MEQYELTRIRTQLLDRKRRLNSVINNTEGAVAFAGLLKEVDSALERMENGSFGICAVCHDPIEEDRLLIDPLLCVCLDHLDVDQRRTLESDLDLAHKIQRSMLPKRDLFTPGWEIHYYYEPAGAVSGDYCDIISQGDDLFFLLGDVSGKGIAASLLMSQLHAMFHSMIPLGMSVPALIEHASKLLCASTISTHYATLLCIKANREGNIEFANAGHFPPLAITANGIEKLLSTGMPIGLFHNAVYTSNKMKLEKGDQLLLYTDGLTESFLGDEEYGIDRVIKVVSEHKNNSPKKLIEELVADVNRFTTGTDKKDDMTVMAIRKI